MKINNTVRTHTVRTLHKLSIMGEAWEGDDTQPKPMRPYTVRTAPILKKGESRWMVNRRKE